MRLDDDGGFLADVHKSINGFGRFLFVWAVSLFLSELLNIYSAGSGLQPDSGVDSYASAKRTATQLKK